VDEATGRRHPTVTAPWGVIEAIPEVPTGDDQAKGPVEGAVAPLTGRTHDPISPTLGTQACAPCLQRLLGYSPGTRLRVIQDRGEPHTGTPVEAMVREAQGRLVRKAQPAYAPELNPQERLWTWRRRVVTHQHGLATLTEHMEARRHVFRDLAGVTEQGRRLCGLKTPESFLASL
jgi:hypothetical protein